MRCGQHGTTEPIFRVIRGIRVPICPECHPRHEGWWFCSCDECFDFRVSHVTHPWLIDYGRIPIRLESAYRGGEQRKQEPMLWLCYLVSDDGLHIMTEGWVETDQAITILKAVEDARQRAVLDRAG